MAGFLESHLSDLRNAFLTAKKFGRKIQILTLSPFTIRETSEFFGASQYLVKKARDLKKSHGIIPEMEPGHRVKLSDETKTLVANFFDSDDVGRVCPGKRESVMMGRNDDGEKQFKQKRLLLMNLRETYALFKEDFTDIKIGFSKFAALRPKNCVLPGAAGTHSVCVCVIHQNVKLQIAGLGVKGLEYKMFLEKTFCDTENEKCMTYKCQNCPKKTDLLNYIEQVDVLNSFDEIRYKQWTTQDRCTLIEISESVEDFISSLQTNIIGMAEHHYVAKSQSKFFKNLKATLPLNEVVLVGDFAENYTFVVQDEIQSFHYEKSQCTVHPFALYYNDNGTVKERSFCFISPSTGHSAAMVHAFIKKLIPDLKIFLPRLSKIHYFSDGASQQYKNKFNLINVYFHDKDFQVACEWHFFASYHGKGVCDGIGGSVKMTVMRESLKRTAHRQILNTVDMVNFLTEKMASVTFYHVESDYIESIEANLEHRYAEVQAVPGTRKFHRFNPQDNNKIRGYFLSSNIENFLDKFIIKKAHRKVICKVDDFVVFMDENDLPNVGFVKMKDETLEEVLIDAMEAKTKTAYDTFQATRHIFGTFQLKFRNALKITNPTFSFLIYYR